jgi:hypothetical protein
MIGERTVGEHKLDRVKSHGWAESQIPDGVSLMERRSAEMLRSTKTRLYDKGPCQVLVSQEPRPKMGAVRNYWHLSISCRDRYPTWEEIKDARYSLLPMGLTFAQILPPMNEFVNIHPNCFHLWELDADE